MRFHVTGLPHTKTNKNYNTCAYTMKILNFCKMMMGLGHEVYHYGTEGSNPDCTENVNIITDAEQKEFFTGEPFQFNPDKVYWKVMNERVVTEIYKRRQPKDFIGIIAGLCQKSIVDWINVDTMIPVEYGIGYGGVFCKYKVYESYAHMHKLWGYRIGEDPDGTFNETVIPNYFDKNDFPFYPKKKDHYCFIGRIVKRKGLQHAINTCNAIGKKLIIAGEGARLVQPNVLVGDDGEVYRGNFDYVGRVSIQQRADLMGLAIAVFVPTIYIEPFGGVNVEAQLYGTPVITTDWGAFTETVEHGHTGYRCQSPEDFIVAAKIVERLNTEYIRQRALSMYSLEAVGPMYNKFFKRILVRS